MDEKVVQGGKFLVVLVLSFTVLSALIDFLIPLKWIELLLAKIVVVFTGGEIVVQQPVMILAENFSVQISYLCTGLMEFIVLVAAIIATTGIKKEKKLIGIIRAGIAVFLFNAGRIIITISLIEKTDLQTIELAHDLLFRISLFVLIAGYYFVWYYSAVKGKTKK
ncbi:MAG: hypothetical protein COT90_05360 [Candidatus Diapherotrites archaeon CG10_big_fil_rev_8_21_14_0_10_31_34]|nr:MAG: hypothetical protein COT90_05360 [Candidatus Diapherotrites archaeon CG10_big_fil_rev_8_21_14_0_10_31_34]